MHMSSCVSKATLCPVMLQKGRAGPAPDDVLDGGGLGRGLEDGSGQVDFGRDGLLRACT